MLFRPLRPMFDFAPDGAPSGGQPAQTSGDGGKGEGNEAEPKVVNYDEWFASLGQPEKDAIESHTKGLKSALDSERSSRQSLEKQLRSMAKTAQDGSEAQKSLTEMADKLADADRRATFYDEAHAAGVTNLKLAYLVAVQDELFDRRGNVDFHALRSSYPELFGAVKKVTSGRAGSGTDTEPPAGGMNEFIRRASGRK